VIGGNDRVYPRGLSREMLDFVLRIFRGFWSAALVQDPDASLVWTVEEAIRSPIRGSRSLMVYRDEAAYESWDILGADPSNDDTMIYVLLGEESTTFVVSDSLPKTPAMVADIILALDVNFPRTSEKET